MSDQNLLPDDLHNFLRRKLPRYMIPSAFVFLKAMPLSPNRKVDRKALPLPEWKKRAFVPPRNELERLLAGIWEKILGIRPIGLRDDFFELGGHSLLAAQLFAEIEKTTGKCLPLATLFQAPTVEALADILRRGTYLASLVPIQPRGLRYPFFCIHGADGEVFYYRNLAHYLGPDRPFYGLEARGLLGNEHPHTRIEEMVEHYIQEIRTVQPQGPYFIGGYCIGGTVAFELARQLYAQGQEVALLALLDAYDWSKIKRGPVWERVYFYIERVVMQLRNFFLVKSGDKMRFVLENYRMVRAQLTQNAVRRQVDDIAHRIAERYVPPSYPGRIISFQSCRTYTRYQAGRSILERLAAGGADIQKLPCYPAGMLMEPFVRELARRLERALTEAEREILSSPLPPCC